MRTSALLSTLPLVACALTAAADALAADGAIATFHSVGITWSPADGSAARAAKVKFRPKGATAYKPGLDLWFDARVGEYRGSIVGLTPGTSYEIALALDGSATTTTMSVDTWSESPPIAKTVTVPATSSDTLTVDQSGTPSGWVLYAPAAGQSATIDVANAKDNAVRISASYVIVRGLTVKGAAHDAIVLADGAHDVFIEDNDISGWGSLRDAQHGWGTNEESGIKVNNTPSVERVVIQRNRIHDARWDTNSWSFGHPAGPQGITFESAGGNHVIRYNEILGNDQHHWEDCVGGGENFSNEGFPKNDSDVYGNVCTYAWDDAYELEGGDRNVRAWGNFMDYTGTGVASATCGIGPLYVFRNVYLHSHKLSEVSLDQDDRGPFAKTGDGGGFGGGRRYYFHNTVLQPPPAPGMQYPFGAGAGIGDDGGPMTNVVSRNNVWQNFKDWHSSIQDTRASTTNDFDYDLYNGPLDAYSGAEPHGIKGAPAYESGNGAASGRGGDYRLAPASPGFDRGVVIPNFNDEFAGAAPDVGAHESGAPAMRFGLDAAQAASTGGGAQPGAKGDGAGGGGGGAASGANAANGGPNASANGAAGNAASAPQTTIDAADSSGCSVARAPTSRGLVVALFAGLALAIRTRRSRRAPRRR